jgi:hypothetical protein
MRLALAVIACVCCFSRAEANDVVASVNEAILQSIEWQQHWYGEAFGADCVKRRAQEGATLTVQLFPPDDFAAYVKGTNVLYSGKLWPGKVVAQPSAGDITTCGPGEIAPQVKFEAAQGKIIRGPFAWRKLKTDNETVSPEKTRLVEAVVIRSVAAYFASEGDPAPSSVRLARYTPNDPFLIVMDEQHNELYTLDFPPIETLDDHTIVDVADWGIFLGSDDQAERVNRARRHLVDEVRRNSRVLETHAGH